MLFYSGAIVAINPDGINGKVYYTDDAQDATVSQIKIFDNVQD